MTKCEFQNKYLPEQCALNSWGGFDRRDTANKTPTRAGDTCHSEATSGNKGLRDRAATSKVDIEAQVDECDGVRSKLYHTSYVSVHFL